MSKLTDQSITCQIFDACFDHLSWNTLYYICSIERSLFSDSDEVIWLFLEKYSITRCFYV